MLKKKIVVHEKLGLNFEIHKPIIEQYKKKKKSDGITCTSVVFFIFLLNL